MIDPMNGVIYVSSYRVEVEWLLGIECDSLNLPY